MLKWEQRVGFFGNQPVSGATKIVMANYSPAAGGDNLLVIQISNMNGDHPQTLTPAEIGWAGQFYPHDVALDAPGRIFVANYYNSAGCRRVVRVNDIDGSGRYLFTDRGSAIESVAVDRTRGVLYYASTNALWKANVDGGVESALNISAGTAIITTIFGMTVDEETGHLYIAGQNGGHKIFRYDSVSQQVIGDSNGGGQVAFSGMGGPYTGDTLVKGSFVYLANSDGSSGWRVMRFSKDLSWPVGYGTISGGTDHSPGAFYGVRRFLAILNGKITIMDDLEYDNVDKIVAMDDINGTDWETFHSSGDGQAFFEFHYYC